MDFDSGLIRLKTFFNRNQNLRISEYDLEDNLQSYNLLTDEDLVSWTHYSFRCPNFKQAGTGPSRRHIQGSKIVKGLPSVNLQYSKIEKPKKGRPSGAPGPASASPCSAKRGHFRNCQHFCRSWRVDPLAKKKFWKKVSQCRKTEREDALGFFNIHSVAKHQKIEGGKIFIFGKKIWQCRKNWKGGPLGIFQHPFCRKTAKKLKGGRPFEEKKFSAKKSRSAEKNWKGDPLVSPGMVCLHGKTGKTFLVQFARPNGAIWCNNIL